MISDVLKDPGSIYRNAPFWSWNDRMFKAELTRQLDEMKDKGWGSAFMHSRVGLVTGYLSDEWMEAIRDCAEHAKNTGMLVWLYDEDKWPSGFAGGLVPEAEPDYRSRALVLLDREQITENDEIYMEIETGGNKKFICKRVESLGSLWFNGASYVDLMNPDMVKAFLTSTHEKYREAFSESFGKEIPGIFTDEPCYNMNTQYKNMPFVPWSDHLPAFFRKLNGYDISDQLDQLFYDTGDYHKTRFDFYNCATRLFMQSFSKQYYDWCERNNLKLTGHYMAEDNLVSQTRWIGAAMPHYQFMHWPGIDKLSKNIDQLMTVKQLTSAADQLGKERTLSEVFGCIGQQSSFFHRKWITDWQAVLGISFVNSHLSLYSMRGQRKRDFPPNLFTQQPWWDDEKPFADYTARLNYLVSHGIRELDILVLHPIASVWSEYSPLHGGYDGGYNEKPSFDYIKEKTLYNEPFELLSKLLLENNLDFHYGDEILMESHAKTESGKLVIGNQSYSTVIVPPMLTLTGNTLRLLKDFIDTAGADKVIFIGGVPDRVDGSKTDLNLPSGISKVKNAYEAVSLLKDRYSERILTTDLATGQNATSVICHERLTEDGRFVLIANTDEKRKVRSKISITAKTAPMAFDLMTGEAYMAPYTRSGDRIEICCALHPAGSLALLFSADTGVLPDVPACLGTGAEFERQYTTAGYFGNWKISLTEDNVLPLYFISLYADGKMMLDNRHVSYAWLDCFYSLPDGTPFKAEYAFDVFELPDDDLSAVIEMAENLDRITLNGTQLKPMKTPGELCAYDDSKSWKDVNFTRVPFGSTLVRGRNVLTIEGKKINNVTGPGTHRRVHDFKEHMPTELEAVYITGRFSVIGEATAGFQISKHEQISNSDDLTKQGCPFYSGKAEFETGFNYQKSGKNVFLKLSDVEAASLRLYVNGTYLNTAYAGPYLFDITEHVVSGENIVKVIASTTLFNLMGPNWIRDIENKLFIGPGSFISQSEYVDEVKLLPFGIGKGYILET